MFRTRLRLLAVTALGALTLLSVGAAPVAAAGPRTLMVDGDGHAKAGKCDAGTPAHTTIQSAIADAHAGDTVAVCPGNYTENLIVNSSKDNLTIIAVEPWKAHIWRSTSLAEDVPLVEIRPGADAVTFRHFTLLFPTTNDCDGPTQEAIFVRGSHAQILGNRIKSNGTDDFYSCGYRDGVLVGPYPATSTASLATSPGGTSNPPASGTVGWNIVREFQDAGIAVLGDQTHATVKRNSVHFGHVDTSCPSSATNASDSVGPGGIVPSCQALGIWYDFGAGGTASGNVIVSDALGIIIKNGAVAPGSSSRTLPSGTTHAPVLYAGVAAGYFGSNGRVNVLGNDIGGAIAGINMLDADAMIWDNTTFYTLAVGMTGEVVNSSIKRNQIDLTEYEIVVQSESGGNLLRRNTVQDNVDTACEDDSTGTGTAGTANTWEDNVGAPSDPLGICESPAP